MITVAADMLAISHSPAADERGHAAVKQGSKVEVTVLVVDDDQTFRAALRDVIAAAPDLLLIGEACSGEESINAVESLSPDLVLMDVAMPGMGGIEAARRILSRHRGVVVVLISVDDPALNPGAPELVGRQACVRKQDLGAAQLCQLWDTAAAERRETSHPSPSAD